MFATVWTNKQPSHNFVNFSYFVLVHLSVHACVKVSTHVSMCSCVRVYVCVFLHACAHSALANWIAFLTSAMKYAVIGHKRDRISPCRITICLNNCSLDRVIYILICDHRKAGRCKRRRKIEWNGIRACSSSTILYLSVVVIPRAAY